MKIKVVKEKENPFFNRKDLVITVIHTSGPTPRTDDITKELATKYKVDESQVVIDYILTKKGLSESDVKAKILNEKPVKVEKEEKVVEEKTEEKPEDKPEDKKEEKEESQPEEKKEEVEKDEAQISESE